MYRGLVKEEPDAGEEDYAFQFESAHFVTLGLLYEQNKRFAGGAFAPMLTARGQVPEGEIPPDDRGSRGPRRPGAGSGRRAGPRGGQAQEARINHPYVKNFVLAKTTPSPASARRSELRPDVQETDGKPESLRREQGQIRGRPARGRGGPAGRGMRRPNGAAPRSDRRGSAEEARDAAGLGDRGRQAPSDVRLQGFRRGLRLHEDVAREAEALNHHPEWFNVYNQVTVDLVTHDPPGITALDFDLAHRAQSFAERRP